ncbi:MULTISPECIES: hypothetical protein [unclassified Streptomyces]|uniref:hypothetical protein n=1 Tax=unclassified Streptomyces TaxID=2593676 RepID=UPI00114CC03C|nr:MULTISPECIES: hypothetical protein [unclassified Streptomyces]MYS20297.1 hypothetical protein [Streptomyces sp. SID4948]
MRRKVILARKDGNFALDLVNSQYLVMVNSVRTFSEYVADPAQRSLILGPASRKLLSAIEDVEKGDGSNGRIELCLSEEQIHALYVLLMWLPTSFNSEEAFVDRVGAFKENLTNMAQGLLVAVGELSAGGATSSLAHPD